MKSKKSVIEELVIQKLERIEQKMDNLLENVVPAIKVDLALTKQQSSASAKVITGIGGLVTIAVSTAVAFLK